MLDAASPQPGCSSEVVRWSAATRLLFRFVFCYLILYLCPSPTSVGLLGFIPGSSPLSDLIRRGWMTVLPWFAIHVLGLSGAAVTVYRPSGTGDKTLDYVMVLALLGVAGIASLIWSVADRKRPHYQVLDSWLRLVVRYFLIYEMFGYGLNKVIPVQFTEPRLTDLLTPIGMKSTTGAYWTLMGISPAYVVFAGLTEVTAGMLLVFNRTKILGAVVAMGVLTNVVATNYGFNLGVKLFSLHLLAMTVFLLVPHVRAFTDFFVRHRTARILDIDLMARMSRPVRGAVLSAKFVLLGVLIMTLVSANWSAYKTIRSRPANTPVYGIYDVESFVRAGRVIPPLSTDGSRWKRVILQTPTGVVVQVMTDTWPWPWYRATYDPQTKTLLLLDSTTKGPRGKFVYSQLNRDDVVLDGTLDGEPLVVRLVRVNTDLFPLLTDTFSWIHEIAPSNQ